MLILSLISIQCWEFNTKVAIQGIGTSAEDFVQLPYSWKNQNLSYLLLYDKYRIQNWLEQTLGFGNLF